jgi:hypothetical protein
MQDRKTKGSANIARTTFLMTCAAALTLIASSAWAQDATPAGRSGRDIGQGIIGTLVFGVIGIVLLSLGFKLFDVLIKHNIETEIFDNKNMAAALLSGAFILGIAVVIAATILSP